MRSQLRREETLIGALRVQPFTSPVAALAGSSLVAFLEEHPLGSLLGDRSLSIGIFGSIYRVWASAVQFRRYVRMLQGSAGFALTKNMRFVVDPSPDIVRAASRGVS